MENARIVLVEDSPTTRELVRFWISKTAHSLTAEAATLDEALSAVEEIADGDLECDVLLLDGNLQSSAANSKDAEIIASRIKGHDLPIAVIDFASIPLSVAGIETEARIDKASLSELGSVIDRL